MNKEQKILEKMGKIVNKKKRSKRAKEMQKKWLQNIEKIAEKL